MEHKERSPGETEASTSSTGNNHELETHEQYAHKGEDHLIVIQYIIATLYTKMEMGSNTGVFPLSLISSCLISMLLGNQTFIRHYLLNF